MPEVGAPEQHQHLEQEAFKKEKARLAQTHRLAGLLSPQVKSEERRAASLRVNEILDRRRDLIREVDARSFNEQHFTNVYHSPDGQETLREELVFFTQMGDGDTPQMLLDTAGKPVLLNAEMYNLEFGRAKYTTIMGEPMFAVPHVNSKGEIVRATKIHIRRSPAELAEIARLTGNS